MELIFIAMILSFVAPIIFAYANPFLNGAKQIDSTRHPTLARAQRIHRYKNVKAREIEFAEKNTAFSNKIIAIEAATDKHIAEARRESTVDDEFNEWDLHFSDITRERDEAIRKEAARVAAEAKAKRDALAAEVRERELAIWTAQEKVRIAQFMADQKALQAQEQEQAAELLRSRENDVQALRKYYVPDHNNQSFGYRIVSVHGLYVRKLPVKASRMVDNLVTGAMVSVNGWISGEELYGNPIWFKLANNAGWVWSGGVDNKSTSGLMNYNYMNEPGDSFVQKSFDGSIINEYAAPSEMKGLIDAKIVAIEKEKNSLALKMRGNSPWEMMNATSITRNGNTVTQLGGLAAPKDTQYNIFSDGDTQTYQPSGHTGSSSSRRGNFWRGTEFEDLYND